MERIFASLKSAKNAADSKCRLMRRENSDTPFIADSPAEFKAGVAMLDIVSAVSSSRRHFY